MKAFGRDEWGLLVPAPLGAADILEYHLDFVNAHFFGDSGDGCRRCQKAPSPAATRFNRLWGRPSEVSVGSV